MKASPILFVQLSLVNSYLPNKNQRTSLSQRTETLPTKHIFSKPIIKETLNKTVKDV